MTEPESWEKTPQSKKRKHKKSGQVKFEEPVVEEPSVPEAPAAPQPVEEVVAAPKVEEAVLVAAVDEEDEEAEQEERRKKEGRRRRKKHGSEDPEEGVRRVVICDNQVNSVHIASRRPCDVVGSPVSPHDLADVTRSASLSFILPRARLPFTHFV